MKPVVRGIKRNVGNNNNNINVHTFVLLCLVFQCIILLWLNFVIGLKFFKPF